jgi:glutamyl-tRNA reductase
MQNISLLGLNHKSASVSVRECLAFTDDEARSALIELRSRRIADEVILFSTCNRVELLMVSGSVESTIAEAKAFLAGYKQVDLDEFEEALYLHQGDDAVRHVFRVAASLDSMVLGEPQILGQIKASYRRATEERTSGVILNRLLHRTFFVAKRIRSDTGIGDRAVSISYAAIELGRKIFGDLAGKSVMLIGAGEMAELAVEHLIRHRSGRIHVANRTFERGVALAGRYNGTPIRFEEVTDYLAKVDIIISSTGAQGYVLSRAQVKAVMRQRRNRPIFFIDIAVPRDIDPEINSLNNVYVYDIDDLNGVIDENIEDRHREAVKAERIVDEAVIHFRNWYRTLEVVPTIKALHRKVEIIARDELRRTMPQLGRLSADDRQALERMSRAMVKKILHEPTRFLKSNGCQGDRSESLDIARRLFGLDAPVPGGPQDKKRRTH